MIKRVLVLCSACLAVAISASAQAQSWKLDPAHSAAQFAVKHMSISTIRGTFTKVNGTVQYNPADVSKTAMDVSINAASVDSRVEMRDNDLRSDHFLDVQKYPVMTFKSSGAEAAGSGKLKVPGDLTIHGITKRVVLDVDGPSQPMKDPRGNMHLGASATTTINRTDFGMNGFQGMIGNDVVLTIDVELVSAQGQSGKQ